MDSTHGSVDCPRPNWPHRSDALAPALSQHESCFEHHNVRSRTSNFPLRKRVAAHKHSTKGTLLWTPGQDSMVWEGAQPRKNWHQMAESLPWRNTSSIHRRSQFFGEMSYAPEERGRSWFSGSAIASQAPPQACSTMDGSRTSQTRAPPIIPRKVPELPQKPLAYRHNTPCLASHSNSQSARIDSRSHELKSKMSKPQRWPSQHKLRLAAAAATYLNSIPENRHHGITGDEILCDLENEPTYVELSLCLQTKSVLLDMVAFARALLDAVPGESHCSPVYEQLLHYAQQPLVRSRGMGWICDCIRTQNTRMEPQVYDVSAVRRFDIVQPCDAVGVGQPSPSMPMMRPPKG